MRRPFIAGNWKLHTTIAEASALAGALARAVGGLTDRDIMVAPPFTALTAVAAALEGSRVALGAQDVFWEENGAFTGEVSPGMLRDAGCSHVIVGHSERRALFGDTDEWVNRKVKASLAAGLSVIMCLGETLSQREAETTLEVIGGQFDKGLDGILPDPSVFSLAYEPVWAIGTGRTATPAQAQEVHAFLRSRMVESWGAERAAATRILYGGSVKPDNVALLMAEEDIDGALVGGASLKAESFADIVKF